MFIQQQNRAALFNPIQALIDKAAALGFVAQNTKV
jgi:hypothetical protein